MEQPGNILIFNISRALIRNGNFIKIHWEYLTGMFHEYPTNIYLPGGSNWLKSSSWMTVTYFFFGHLCVFRVFFTLVRVTLELLAINGEKPQLLFVSLKKIFLCLMGSYYWDIFRFQSINKFLENRDQISLDTRTFSAIFLTSNRGWQLCSWLSNSSC